MSIRNNFLSKQILTKLGSTLPYLEVFSLPYNNSSSIAVLAVENLVPLSQSHEGRSFMRKWSKLSSNKNREIHLHSQNNKTLLTTSVLVAFYAKRFKSRFRTWNGQLHTLLFFQTKHRINIILSLLKNPVPLYNHRETVKKTQELFTSIRSKSANSTFSVSAFFINLNPAVS